METAPRFDVAKLKADLAAKGWLPRDLAVAAGVSPATVSRVLSGNRDNPRTIKLLASALGHEPSRYVLEPVTS